MCTNSLRSRVWVEEGNDTKECGQDREYEFGKDMTQRRVDKIESSVREGRKDMTQIKGGWTR